MTLHVLTPLTHLVHSAPKLHDNKTHERRDQAVEEHCKRSDTHVVDRYSQPEDVVFKSHRPSALLTFVALSCCMRGNMGRTMSSYVVDAAALRADDTELKH